MDHNLAIAIAHRHVHRFADQPARVNGEHEKAMECRECEDFLQAGIDAYKWLTNAEETIREGAHLGIQRVTPGIRDALDALYNAWLQPCDVAEEWIESLRNRGFTPDNLDDFRRACDDVRDIVERLDWQKRATTARVLSSEEEW